jgi:acetyl esterase/lipase
MQMLHSATRPPRFPRAAYALARAALCFALFASVADAAALKQAQELAIWPAGKVPGSAGLTLTETVVDGGTPGDPQRSIKGVTVPTVTAYLPSKPNGAAAVIVSGGGYTNLVIDKEGTDIARWLNTLGITAFVLKHRLPGEGHVDGPHVPLQDGQRAMRLVRSQAAEWGLDASRIGIVGLSSGAHMASVVGTAYKRDVYAAVDGVDAISARPDFMVLAYGPFSSNARKYLIDPNQPPVTPPEKQAIYDEFPTDQLVDANTPPTFLMHTDEDDKVDPRNSVRFYMALKKAGLPGELHIFKDGKHGVAIRKAKGLGAEAWPQLCAAWFASVGVVPKR